MLKKLLVLVTLMSMLLTMAVPCVNVSAAFTDGTNTFPTIDGGTIVMERSYTPTQDGVVNFHLDSHDEKNASSKKYNIIVKLDGTNVYSPGGTSVISNLALKKGETYLVTLVFRHFKDDINDKITPAKYYLYINGACVVDGGPDSNNGSKVIHDSIVQGTNNITTVFVSDDSNAVFDMAPYNATISSTDANIVLGATEKRNDVAFGGFTAKLTKAMTVSEFTQKVTPATDATLSVKRSGEALANDAYIATGDVIEVISQNEKVVNEYAVTDAPVVFDPAVSSTTYTVEENTIKGVYEYTPVSTFINYLTVEEGWTLNLKNGSDEVTGGVVTEAMTLVAVDTEGNEQTYTIDIADRVTKVSSQNGGHYALNTQIPVTGSFRGNLVIEMETKVMDKYYTGPGTDKDKDPNYAFQIVSDADGVSFIMNTHAITTVNKSYWKSTDLKVEDSLSLTFVARPDDDTNKLDYYINGDYISTCDMKHILKDIWKTWRFHTHTAGSAFMVEDLDAYMAAKNADKIKLEADKVSAHFAGKTAGKLYLAIYSGNELESLQIANLSDVNFKNNVLSIPSDLTGKTVKAFLWTNELYPLDFKLIG